jgi:hypothetical protein
MKIAYKMKQIKNLLAMLLPLIFAAGCNKDLNVEPQNNLTEIRTGADVTALLFGGYKLLQNPSAFGEQYILMADLLAKKDQVVWTGTFTTYRQIADKSQDKTSPVATSIWENSYDIINTVNTVLDKIDLVDESDQAAIAAEAKFIRGITYFELVNYFGKPYSAGNVESNLGVPLVLEPVYIYDSTKNKPSRASVADVYQQVITDITDAVNNLPAEANDGRATSYAAEAFLSRVYMQMLDYENAATMANDVIQSGNYRPTTNYSQAFNNATNSTEDVFGIQQTSQSNSGTSNNGLTTFYADYGTYGGRGDVQVAPGYFDYFTGSDVRQAFVYDGYSINGTDGTYTLKWAEFYRVIPVVRLAEMYLTRGEANLRKGGDPIGDATPLEDINTVRQRSNASPLNSVTGDDFADERFRELGFEGDRLWTLKRLQEPDVDGQPYDDPKLVLPIPQREIDVNSNLTQNDGYN